MSNRKKNSDDDDKKSSKDIAILFLKLIALIVIVVFIGTLGFIVYEGTDWVNSFQNAVFIFTTTGIVEPITTPEGKIYASLYNIITSIFVLFILGILIREAAENTIV